MKGSITTLDDTPVVHLLREPNVAAKQRILSQPSEPLFLAAWKRVLMIHFEVEAKKLQHEVPFQLDLWNGRAFISLVAFTMCGMRPRLGGKLAALLLRPIATHEFLNVRTYVRQGDECGIHFLAEWLPNLLSVRLGPATFGLPYHYGRIAYEHDWRSGRIRGRVTDAGNHARLEYHGELIAPVAFQPCAPGSFDEWLMERYAAFNSAHGRQRYFRVWHPAWLQRTVAASLDETTLLTNHWPWFERAHLVGANFSPGFEQVGMGWPRRCSTV
jgi:uncharacterized protein YqjF (DUF2071 family)